MHRCPWNSRLTQVRKIPPTLCVFLFHQNSLSHFLYNFFPICTSNLKSASRLILDLSKSIRLLLKKPKALEKSWQLSLYSPIPQSESCPIFPFNCPVQQKIKQGMINKQSNPWDRYLSKPFCFFMMQSFYESWKRRD